MIDQLYRRARMMIGLGTVQTSTDDGPVQKLQVLLGQGQTRDNTPNLQNYGHSSRPHVGADVVMLSIGGDRSNSVIVAVGDQRYRIALVEGEVAIHDDIGQKVHLTRAGIVQNAPHILCAAIGGTGLYLLNEMAMVTFNTHTHASNGSPPTQQMVVNVDTTTVFKAG